VTATAQRSGMADAAHHAAAAAAFLSSFSAPACGLFSAFPAAHALPPPGAPPPHRWALQYYAPSWAPPAVQAVRARASQRRRGGAARATVRGCAHGPAARAKLCTTPRRRPPARPR
jgi:hypothetical protein